MRKIRYGTAEIIEEIIKGGVDVNETDNLLSGQINRRLIKFNGRYYTVIGRMFAVAGKHLQTGWDDLFKIKHYSFSDWNTLSNMYLED